MAELKSEYGFTSLSEVGPFLDTLMLPNIKSNQIVNLLSKFCDKFKHVYVTSNLWICGRIEQFGFRPKQVPYLKDIYSNWVSKLMNGYIVVTPVIFYKCDAVNAEKVNNDESDTNFMVGSHYNVLISYLDATNIIQIERYEPSNATYQGNLNNLLGVLITSTMREFTECVVHYEKVAKEGLQCILKDKLLCGYHIVYWVIYRLKYNLIKALEMLDNPEIDKFIRFCKRTGGLELLNEK
jgi:hypothetical protein